jgi:hypothetical protein
MAGLVAFLNQANRSLVEPIDIEGKKLQKSRYFFDQTRAAYPKLWEGLNRIRSYRNRFLHLELNQLAEEHYRHYIAIDFDSVDPVGISDGSFRVQAAILDGLLIALQAEIAVYETLTYGAGMQIHIVGNL